MPAAKSAKSAPAKEEIKEPGKEVAKQLQSYYRIRKLSTFLYEIVEVQVDESEIVPKPVGKQDTREILMVKLEDLLNKRK